MNKTFYDMESIKSYTTLEQSKKLAKILPIESADMMYDKIIVIPFNDGTLIPCWSLAALIGVLPKGTRLLKSATDDTYHCDCPKGNINKWFDNPIDAAFEIIIKLHELNRL